MLSRDSLSTADPDIWQAILAEGQRQEEHLELIASENYTSQAVLEAQGSLLTNKYAEGYPEKRYYGGCQYVDQVEQIAIERAQQLFQAEAANVQPNSGSQANQAVLLAMLKPGDTILGMSLAHGGHLTHGSSVNLSGKWFNAIGYGLDRDEKIDYVQLETLAKAHRPKLIIAGASAYSLTIDFERIGEIARSVGAYYLVDMAHYAGLIAAGLYPSPVAHADFVTTTTHKTLRGPRGGIILCKQAHEKKIKSAVFPGLQGGPLMHVIAGKAVALLEALRPEFKQYQQNVLDNAQTLSETLSARGLRIVSGGTQSHLMLVDLRRKGLTGKHAEKSLEQAHLTVNKNAIPDDPQSPFVTSGIRIGTPAMTSRGLQVTQAHQVAQLIANVLDAPDDLRVIAETQRAVRELCARYPVYV